ncbi:MAG: SpaA isopeptide-forming pilin-related protein [Candidatus Fimenecus sp.]
MNKKKIIVSLISFILAALLAISAFASSTPADDAIKEIANNNSKASVTVETGNNGDILNAYKVVNTVLESDGQLTFTFTDTFNAFKAATPEYSSLTVEDYCNRAKFATDSAALKKLLGEFTAFVKNPANTVSPNATSTTLSDGRGVFNNLPLGQYILVGSGNNKGAFVYQTITAEVVPFVENNQYKIYNKYNVVMKTTKPTANKDIENGTKLDGVQHTASIGDEIGFKLTSTVPTYPEGSTNRTYFMADTLSNGLTLKSTAAQFIVKGYTDGDQTGTLLTLNNEYKITIEGQKIYIDYDYEKIKQYSNLSVQYKAVLNENAQTGTQNGNPNTLELIFSNAPYENSTYKPGDPNRPNDKNGYGKIEDKEIIYTYSLILNKYNSENHSEKLQGAVFEIYNNAECTGAPISTLTTDNKGFAALNGISAGDYWLKETHAPAGYKKAVKPIKISVSKDTSGIFGTSVKTKEITYTSELSESKFGVQATDSDGNLLWLSNGQTEGAPHSVKAEGDIPAYVKTVSYTVSEATEGNGTAAQGQIVVGVANTKGFSLPSTGGMGTMIFTFSGLTIALGALILFIIKQRKNLNNN